MPALHRRWRKRNEKDLARFVDPAFATCVELSQSRVDRAGAPEGRRGLAAEIYEQLAAQSIEYAFEKYDPEDTIQQIRSPAEILDRPGEGTCLDLALLYSGICVGLDLLPVVVITAGHAFVLVSLTHDRSQWDAYDRGEGRLFAEPLRDAASLRALVEEGRYLPVECTGFASVESLPETSPEGRGRVGGLLPFDRAVDAGGERLLSDEDPLRFAVDVATAHENWVEPLSMVVGERVLEYDPELGVRLERLVGTCGSPPDLSSEPAKALGLEPIDLLDRADERTAVLGDDGRSGFVGRNGVGKTAMLRWLAHHDHGDRFPDGVAHVRVRSQAVEDVLEQVTAHWHAPARGRKLLPQEAGALLADKAALVLLDDVVLGAEDIEWLQGHMRRSRLVLASPTRDPLGRGRGVDLGGLPVEDSIELFQSVLGRNIHPTERDTAAALMERLDGHPATIVTTAATARDRGTALDDLLASLDAGTVDDAVLDPAVDSVTADDRRLLALLRELRATVGTGPLQAMFADADASLDRLEAASLVQSNSPRYRASAVFDDAQPAPPPGPETFPTWIDRLSGWVSGAAADEVAAEVEVILASLRVATHREDLPGVLRLARAAEPGLVEGGLWGAWEQVLQLLRSATSALGDVAGEAWAIHQLGSRAAALGEGAIAGPLLTEAASMREGLGDADGAALSQHNLQLTAPPPGVISRAARWIRRHWLASGVLIAGAVTAIILLTVVNAGAGVLALGASDPVEVRLGNSTALEVTIANFGDGGLEIDSIDLLAPEESGFVLDPSERARCEQIVIDPQDACRLVIQFTPRQPGTAEATLLALAGDDEQTVVLTGVGFTGPVLELEGVGEFGNQLVDTTSDREFVVRNAGDRPLAVGRIVIRGESTRAFPMRGESSCLGALDPGTDCGFVVGFRPAERTAYVAELVIEWEEGDAVLAISGTGIVEGSIGFEEFGGEFGDVTVGEFADGVVLATNGGDTTISPLGLDLAGGGFRLEDTDCAESLPPGAACGILIRFQPAEPGSYQGAVAVGGVQLPLSGRGVEGVAVLSPVDPGGFYVLPVGVFPNLEFIFVQYDFQVDLLEGTEDFVNEPREVVITNTGEGLLRLGKIAFESPQQEFILQANACSSATLAPDEVCTFELVFAPTSPGEKEAFIAIEYEQGRGPLRGRIIGVAYSYVG